ncbi:hypothetical protein CPCC7001_594 [Cyanobium sp. PCC 7001]|uniref:hypothetical protein n=1 Tax=Cyanobium sp. PCC 7001 TaxID=180281 RepID=UPI0001805947|nr:hypothetical protein [Cyanobium sp. PCC 7001]EDY37715.1 hypothetical protein CPCC7001_594 [Cyanobium sp. PCC 7001]
MRIRAQLLRRLWALALGGLLLLGPALPAGAVGPSTAGPSTPGPTVALPRSWRVRDQNGRSWGLTLLPVGDATDPDSTAPRQWRLRLTARSAGLRPDHQAPLVLADGQEQTWSLANSSGELVPEATQPWPAGAAQFRGELLQPAPRDGWPLELRIPLDPGDGPPLDPARVTLGPEPAAVLQQLSRSTP